MDRRTLRHGPPDPGGAMALRNCLPMTPEIKIALTRPLTIVQPTPTGMTDEMLPEEPAKWAVFNFITYGGQRLTVSRAERHRAALGPVQAKLVSVAGAHPIAHRKRVGGLDAIAAPPTHGDPAQVGGSTQHQHLVQVRAARLLEYNMWSGHYQLKDKLRVQLSVVRQRVGRC